MQLTAEPNIPTYSGTHF